MKNKEYFKGKEVLVVGFARSGVAAANLLYDLGAHVFVSDNQDNPNTQNNILKLKSKDIKIELGRHSKEFVKNKDFVIISPGVSNSALPVIWAKEAGIPLISEIEFSWILCPAEVIAITGTNGKTTVTTLIGKVLEVSGRKTFVCGNIGKPFSSEVKGMQEGDFVSLEVSSFQLEYINTFKPKVAVILNLSRNHLDRYESVTDYLSAKKHIFQNLSSSDFLVLNYDDPLICNLARETKARIVYFRKTKELNSNQAAVLSVASVFGIDKDLVLNVFNDFKGVEHRMEEVLKVGDVRFINDSKSTTTEATVWALNNLDCPVILIAGGREKGNDYGTVLELARKKVKAAVLIGEAKEKIKNAFMDKINVVEAINLDEAVTKAFSLAKPGECILFSPMCKSFDMFSDYEERGRLFKKKVIELAGV